MCLQSYRPCLPGIILQGCLLGTGTGDEGEERMKVWSQAPTQKTKDAMDQARTTKMLRQCPLTTVQLVYNATAVSTAVQNSP